MLISSYHPENDLIALIEQYRTGPFRPMAHVYESIVHNKPDVVFGIDLSKWAGEGGWNAVRAKNDQKEHTEIPSIVTCLLAGMSEAYEKLPNDIGKFAFTMIMGCIMHVLIFRTSQKLDLRCVDMSA